MTSVVDVLWAVQAPAPLMSRQRAAELTQREREILDELEKIFQDGFAHLTMADIAARLNCSLRTLYGLASNRDDLFLLVNDRVIRSHGYAAKSAISPNMSGLEATKAFLHLVNETVPDFNEQFLKDLATFPPGWAREQEYTLHTVDVVRELLNFAVEQREMAPLDTHALAVVLCSAARILNRPEVVGSLLTPPLPAANSLIDTLLDGLACTVAHGTRARARKASRS